MARKDTKRHMSPAEVAQTADWIVTQPDLPSWQEVRTFVLQEFSIDRTVEALRRIQDLKAARRTVAAAPRRKSRVGPRPTTRKMDALTAYIARLEAEMDQLRAENLNLLERNLRLINGARVHQIPESDFDRALVPVNRNPTQLAHRQVKK